MSGTPPSSPPISIRRAQKEANPRSPIELNPPDVALLTKKSHAAQLEPISTRLDRVLAFSQFFKPGLETYDVVPIQDVYGPTATERDVQALVLSRETVAGGEAGSFILPFLSSPPPLPLLRLALLRRRLWQNADRDLLRLDFVTDSRQETARQRPPSVTDVRDRRHLGPAFLDERGRRGEQDEQLADQAVPR